MSPLLARLRPLGERIFRAPRELRWGIVVHAALVPVAVGLVWATSIRVSDENAWVKPGRFAASIAVYLVTLAVLLAELPRRAAERVVAAGSVAALCVETILIWVQAGRGTTSHFNTSTPLDAAIFSVMGAMIGLNTLLAGVLATLFFVRRTSLSFPVVVSIRAGLVLFVAGSLVGAQMAAIGTHAVGASHGDAGLPVVGWSRLAGDLRLPHFVGLHALQALPLVGLWARGRDRGSAWVTAATVGWAAVLGATWLAATLGRSPY